MSHPFAPLTRTVNIDGSSQRKTVNGCAFNITWPQQQLNADRETIANFLSRFGHCEVVDAPDDKRDWAQEFAQQFNQHRMPTNANTAQHRGGAL